MIACNLSPNAAQDIIYAEGTFNKLVIACRNSPKDCVLSGPTQQVHRFVEQCERRGAKCKVLDVPFGFHSEALEPVMDKLVESCRAVEISEPEIPLGSNLHGRMVAPGDLSIRYFANQMRHSVRFQDMLQSMLSADLADAIFIEIGPAATTLPMIKNTFSNQELTLLASLNPKQDAWTPLTASALTVDHKLDVFDWRAFFDGSGSQLVDGPQYPFEPQELYTPYTEEISRTTPNSEDMDDRTSRPFELQRINVSDQSLAVFESPMLSLSKYIIGHSVRGTALCPASVYYQLAIESAMLTSENISGVFTIEDVRFDHPLLYGPSVSANQVRISLGVASDDTNERSIIESFKIMSSPGQTAKKEEQYCSGRVVTLSKDYLKGFFARKAAMVQRQRSHLDRLNGYDCDTFTTRMLYETIFPRVVDYSKEYQTIVQLTALANGSEAFGTFKLPQWAKEQNNNLPPAFTDTLFHASGFIANCHTSSSEVCICVRVESIRILYKDIDPEETFSIYCSLFEAAKGEVSADAYAAKSDGTVVGVIEGMVFKKLQMRALESSLKHQSSSPNPPKSSSAASPQIAQGIRSQAKSLSIKTSESQHDISKRVSSELLEVVAKVSETPVESIQPDSSLKDLGVDSLAQIELSEEIPKRFPGLNLDVPAIVASEKVRDIQKSVSEAVSLAKPEHTTTSEPNDSQSSLVEKSTSYLTPPDSPTTNIKSVIHEVCGIPLSELQPDTTLESLGIDSLLSIELAKAFQDIGVEIDQSNLSADVTLEALANSLGNNRKPSVTPDIPAKPSHENVSSQNTSGPVRLQANPRPTHPLFLFHDGSGTVGMYASMKELNRQVYGFANHTLTQKDRIADSLTTMASRYASSIASTTNESILVGGKLV